MGCGVCGAFPFIAGMSTTMANMGIIYTSSPVFIVILSVFLFSEKISLNRIVGLIICLIGVITIITKGNFNYLINFSFTTGDFWMLGAAIGWALYSIYLLNWKSKFSLMGRFTLIAFFGFISLFPFYILEESLFFDTKFNSTFLAWVLFAAISPGIIAFSLYTYAQKYLGATTTGLTLYLFTVYGAFYGIVFFNENLEIYHYVSTILVFLGIYLVKKKIKNEKI